MKKFLKVLGIAALLCLGVLVLFLQWVSEHPDALRRWAGDLRQIAQTEEFKSDLRKALPQLQRQMIERCSSKFDPMRAPLDEAEKRVKECSAFADHLERINAKLKDLPDPHPETPFELPFRYESRR